MPAGAERHARNKRELALDLRLSSSAALDADEAGAYSCEEEEFIQNRTRRTTMSGTEK